MFTGLVETVGTIESREEFDQGMRFRLVAPGFAETLSEGESVALDGVHSTLKSRRAGSFERWRVRPTSRGATAWRCRTTRWV